MNTLLKTPPDMTALIEARVASVMKAHANNLIEGQDMGAEALAELLAIARLPITDDEFTARAVAATKARFAVNG